MKIALGIPVYNDIYFIDRSVKNALNVGFDEIVYFDDGSIDGTYEKLLSYAKQNEHIHVFRNEENSLFSGVGNKWQIVAEKCREFNPDWIMVRAADECLSCDTFARRRNLLRENLEQCSKHGITTTCFPYVNLWRSEWWWRADNVCGSSLEAAVNESCWRNDSGWAFEGSKVKAGLHFGLHAPNVYKSMRYKNLNINLNHKRGMMPQIVILHYGMSSHELIESKLKRYIELKKALPDKVNMPVGIPVPKNWAGLNTFKIGYEKNIILKRMHQGWIEENIPDEPMPKIKSLYSFLLQYDRDIAEEYRNFYGGSVVE
jgi:glycosyltransferase involved in cell wall biosynthesis